MSSLVQPLILSGLQTDKYTSKVQHKKKVAIVLKFLMLFSCTGGKRENSKKPAEESLNKESARKSRKVATTSSQGHEKCVS